MKYYSIAIDGPAGSGKSTIAKIIASKLNLVYVDTGAMYRALAIFFMDNGIDPADENAVVEKLDGIEVSIKYIDNAQHVILNGTDVTPRLREEAVGSAASTVSAHFLVRAKMVELQQRMALSENIIMDGRDIGSVVLPNATVKIYLSASVEVRAQRRFKELTEKGQSCDLAEIARDIEERDYNDMHRKNSPLTCVPDAVVVDSSYMTIDEVAERIISLFLEAKEKS